jgi:hypothetical protein
MMSTFAKMMVALFVFSSEALAQLPAQHQQGTNQPQPPSQNVPGTHEYADVNDQLLSYKIGIYGQESLGGVVVLGTTRIFDLDKNRHRSAAQEIMVDFLGNGKLVPVKLEQYDIIQSIDGHRVQSLSDLAVFLNSASDPRRITIGFRDHRTGQEYVGRLNAVRVR